MTLPDLNKILSAVRIKWGHSLPVSPVVHRDRLPQNPGKMDLGTPSRQLYHIHLSALHP